MRYPSCLTVAPSAMNATYRTVTQIIIYFVEHSVSWYPTLQLLNLQIFIKDFVDYHMVKILNKKGNQEQTAAVSSLEIRQKKFVSVAALVHQLASLVQQVVIVGCDD